MYYLYYGSEEATIEIVKEKGEDWKTFVSVFKGSLPEAFKQENIREAGPIGEKQAMAFVESLKGAKRIPIEVALKKRS
jgi:hypothetical protein